MGSLVFSWFGALFFLASAIIIAASITYPTAVLLRSGREDKVQCAVLLFTWLAPLINLIVVLFPSLVALYPLVTIPLTTQFCLISQLAFIMVAVVISNIIVFVKYRPPMDQSAWSFIGFILALILLDGLILWLGPVFPRIAQLLPYKSSIS